MQESIDRTVSLDDVEKETFLGFAEFAYRGKYRTPSFEDDHGLSLLNNTSPAAVLALEPTTLMFPIPNICRRDDWAKRQKPAPYPEERYQEIWTKKVIPQIVAVKLVSKPFAPDVMFHAKLYVFATKYLIEPLRRRSLAYLHQDLSTNFTTRLTTTQLLDLLEYTYKHTGREEVGGPSKLRRFVICRVACEMPILAKLPRFRDLLRAFGDMVVDLVEILARIAHIDVIQTGMD